MIPEQEQDRIRREAEAKAKKFYGEEFIELSREGYESNYEKGYKASGSAAYLRYQPVVDALNRIAKQLTIKEQKKEYGETGDIDVGYDAIISVARETLKKFNKKS